MDAFSIARNIIRPEGVNTVAYPIIYTGTIDLGRDDITTVKLHTLSILQYQVFAYNSTTTPFYQWHHVLFEPGMSISVSYPAFVYNTNNEPTYRYLTANMIISATFRRSEDGTRVFTRAQSAGSNTIIIVDTNATLICFD